MNINEWIKENSTELEDLETCVVEKVISVDKLHELLKTHAIVPREPSAKTILIGAVGIGKKLKVSEMYKAMIEAAEND